MTHEMSLPDIMKEIKRQYRKIRKIELINQEYYELKVSLNRLNIQIEKQTLFKKKLMNEINCFKKSKKEYENELNDALYNNRIITSKINDQFEEIQRLLAVEDDKNEFRAQQMKIQMKITNCTNKTTTLLLKRLESENKDKYYKSLCKNLMIQDILSNNINIEKMIKWTEDNISLNEKYHISKKDLKSALDNFEVCKYKYGSYFDEFYNETDKTETLKFIIITSNLLITNGYMCYWKSMNKVLKKNIEIWTTPTQESSGMHFKFKFPVECVDKNKNLITNHNQIDNGFKSLHY